uniref:Uncharacterized protein n=1 Tax=Tolypothrix bouteillei VB521301 TaxID=1479485 RepID=A0A0C1R5I2_9CYAN
MDRNNHTTRHLTCAGATSFPHEQHSFETALFKITVYITEGDDSAARARLSGIYEQGGKNHRLIDRLISTQQINLDGLLRFVSG